MKAIMIPGKSRRHKARFTGLVALVCLVFITSGCSTFHREWKEAKARPIPSGSLAGPWDGHWISNVNGHKGRLRCVITQSAPNSFRAHFHAKYKRILSFSYAVPLAVHQTNGAYRFSGEANLGKLAGGIYHYEGHSDGARFESSYKSKYDHGKFEMSRPP